MSYNSLYSLFCIAVLLIPSLTMKSDSVKQFLFQSFLSLTVLGLFIFWVETDAAGMHSWLLEDGLIESLGAIFFGISSICFFVAAKRSSFLRGKPHGLCYFMIVAWGVLMFIFMGEEISWGQRIFGFSTPELLSSVNGQNEFNIHNVEFVDSFMGGKYRYLSIMMVTTGFLLPVFSLTPFGKKTIQWWAFPVSPLGYCWLFVGAYLYGKFYRDMTLVSNDAAEAREFLLAVAMMFFSIHGSLFPNDLFRKKQ